MNVKNSNLTEVKFAQRLIERLRNLEGHLDIDASVNHKYPDHCPIIMTIVLHVTSFPFVYNGVRIIVNSELKLTGYIKVIEADFVRREMINDEISEEAGIPVESYEYDFDATFNKLCDMIEMKGRELIDGYLKQKKEELQKDEQINKGGILP